MILQLELVQPVSFSREIVRQLRYLTIAGMPEEVCGLIYPHDIIVQYPNTHRNPLHAFDFEAPLDHHIKAMWHSHPFGPEAPSQDDMPCMKLLVEHGFDFHHIIVTTSKVFEYAPVLVEPAKYAFS